MAGKKLNLKRISVLSHTELQPLEYINCFTEKVNPPLHGARDMQLVFQVDVALVPLGLA